MQSYLPHMGKESSLLPQKRKAVTARKSFPIYREGFFLQNAKPPLIILLFIDLLLCFFFYPAGGPAGSCILLVSSFFFFFFFLLLLLSSGNTSFSHTSLHLILTKLAHSDRYLDHYSGTDNGGVRGHDGVTGVKKVIFTKKASSPTEYLALMRDLCI